MAKGVGIDDASTRQNGRMMIGRMILAVSLLLGLAACGADGKPMASTQPDLPETGLVISGDAQMGIVGNP
jgi:hypothetical protein